MGSCRSRIELDRPPGKRDRRRPCRGRILGGVDLQLADVALRQAGDGVGIIRIERDRLLEMAARHPESLHRAEGERRLAPEPVVPGVEIRRPPRGGAALGRGSGGLGEPLLHADRALHGVHRARELGDEAVADGLDHATAESLQGRQDHQRAGVAQPCERSLLVGLHLPRIADDIRREYCGEPALITAAHRRSPSQRRRSGKSEYCHVNEQLISFNMTEASRLPRAPPLLPSGASAIPPPPRLVRPRGCRRRSPRRIPRGRGRRRRWL